MKWRARITDAWRTVVARFNRKAYVRHAAKHPFCGLAIDEEALWLETQEWTRRGKKVNVWVTDVPLPQGVTTHWKQAQAEEWGDFSPSYLPYSTLRQFRKIVEDAEYEKARRRREGRELWVKYFTAIAAALAALASLANLYFSSRKK